MVQRMWAEAAGPAGGAEPLFPGSRRSRSVWDAVRLEVGGPDSCPVVLHSFTQLDPDLPRLEVGEPGPGPRPSERVGGGGGGGQGPDRSGRRPLCRNPPPRGNPRAAGRAWGRPRSWSSSLGTGAGLPAPRPRSACLAEPVPASRLHQADLFPRAVTLRAGLGPVSSRPPAPACTGVSFAVPVPSASGGKLLAWPGGWGPQCLPDTPL